METAATIDGQFYEFARMADRTTTAQERTGETITLYRSDYWLRQAGILDDRSVRMTDTGIIWNNKFSKTEITFEEWSQMISELCAIKDLDETNTLLALTNCGLPGATSVNVPNYRDFFDTYTNAKQLINSKIDM